MAETPPATLEEHLWTIAVARLLFPPEMNIQAPPNLSVGALRPLVDAGINDWGGVSPVTPDHVNPEAPWPHLQVLERATNVAGKQLVERLALYPAYARSPETWVDPKLQTMLLRKIDGDGWPRTDDWSAGLATAVPQAAVGSRQSAAAGRRSAVSPLIERATAGVRLDEHEIARLFQARGDEYAAVCSAADALRQDTSGDTSPTSSRATSTTRTSARSSASSARSRKANSARTCAASRTR